MEHMLHMQKKLDKKLNCNDAKTKVKNKELDKNHRYVLTATDIVDFFQISLTYIFSFFPDIIITINILLYKTHAKEGKTC